MLDPPRRLPLSPTLSPAYRGGECAADDLSPTPDAQDWSMFEIDVVAYVGA